MIPIIPISPITLMTRRWIFALTTTLCLVAAAPAWGQPALVESYPAAGTTVTASPDEVILDFDEPLEQTEGTRDTLLQETGQEHVIQTRILTEGRRAEVNIPLPDLEPGEYEFHWDILTEESERLRGELSFTLAEPAGNQR